jgi:hypothetical protein
MSVRASEVNTTAEMQRGARMEADPALKQAIKSELPSARDRRLSGD